MDPTPTHPPAGDAPQSTELSALVDEVLSHTAAVFHEIEAMLKSNTQPSEQTLKRWKRLSGKSNLGVYKSCRMFWEREQRLHVEKAILKQAIANERMDRDATAIMVMEKLRSHSTILSGDIDRAWSAASAAQVALSELAPAPPTSYHGATFLALRHKELDDAPGASTSRAAA